MASKSKKSVKKAVKKSIVRENTIKAFASQLVKDASLTAEAIVAKVKAKFPKSAFKLPHVYWYRGQAGVTTELKRLGGGRPVAKKAVKKVVKKTVKKAVKKSASATAPAAGDAAQAAL